MDFHQKLDSIFGSLSEDRTNKADAGHYKWRGTSDGRAKTNAQQRRKQSTRHGKNVDNAKHAAQADVQRGTFPDGSKVPEKPKNCPKCGRSDKQMVKSHEAGHDKSNYHNWKWLCSACHAGKDNNQQGDKTHTGPVRSPQNDGPSGTGNKSGQRESIEYMLQKGIIVEAPTPKGAGDRFLPQPTKRARGRGRKRSYAPRYSISERFPPLKVDAFWNRTTDPKKVKYTIHPVDLGLTMATRSGKGDPLKYSHPTIKSSKYFAFSQPNYVKDNTIIPQDESYINPDQLMKRYNEIVAVIPKNQQEQFSSASIDIKGDEVVYQEPEETTGEIKTRYFTPPIPNKGVERPGSPAAKDITAQVKPPVSGKITSLSNDQIAQFLHPSTTMVGRGGQQAAREYETEQAPRWSSAYMRELKEYLMHGDRTFKIHPDVYKAIQKGIYGKDLAEYFRKNLQKRGYRSGGKTATAQTQFSQSLQKLTKKAIDGLPTMDTPKGIYKVVATDRNEDKWGYPASKKKGFTARDLPELLRKFQGKKIYFAIFNNDYDTYENQELIRRIAYAHQADQYRKGLTRAQPPQYRPRPNQLKAIQLKSATETAAEDEKHAKFTITYVDLSDGKTKSVEVAPGYPLISIVNLTKRLTPKTKKPNRRPGVAESIARHESENIIKISRETYPDLVSPPRSTLSIEDISNLID